MNNYLVSLAFILMQLSGYQSSHAMQTRYLIAFGNPYNPLHYETGQPNCALSNSTICTIQILATDEIYTLKEALMKRDLRYWGKPKVDAPLTTIKQDVDDALFDPGTTFIAKNGRRITKR